MYNADLNEHRTEHAPQIESLFCRICCVYAFYVYLNGKFLIFDAEFAQVDCCCLPLKPMHTNVYYRKWI